MRQTVRRHGRDNRIFGADPIPPGEWIYAGGTADPGWTENSPAFQNGWENVGSGLQGLRFRITNEDQLEVEGAVTGGTVGTVVTTLPDLDAVFRSSVFWPAATVYAVGANGDESVAIWKLEPNGDLWLMGTVSGGVTAAEIIAAGGIVFDENNEGGSLDVTTTFDIDLESLTGNVDLYAGNAVTIGSDFSIDINANTTFFVNGTTSADLFSGTTGVSVTPTKVTVQLTSPGGTLEVNGSGGTIFQVDYDGTVHLKAGASIVYDL